MQVGSPEFIALLVLAVLLFHLRREPAWRAPVLLVANGVFVASWSPRGWQAVTLLCLLGAGLAVARAFQTQSLRGRVALGAVIVAWAAGWYALQRLREGDSSAVLVGYSYLMFKHIHVCIDAANDDLPPLSVRAWLNYTLNFTSWTSGPILRYQAFRGWEDAPAPTRLEVLAAIDRMLVGCLKAIIVAPWIYPWITPTYFLANLGDSGPVRAGMVTAFVFGYYSWIYLNFSGYCDIVIGATRLFGFTLPENFARPWLATNVTDFWRRWHITLSDWLRDYVFTPSYRGFSRWMPGALAAAPAYLLTFLVAGLWHGLSAGFALFGLAHGIAALAHHFWAIILARVLSRERLRAYRQSRVVGVLALICCQVYVAATMLIFGWPLSQVRIVLTHVAGW